MVESLKPQLESQFGQLRAAFLEFCQPGIGDVIDELVIAGANKITVVPYFLNHGRHVSEDIPHELMLKQSQYPNLSIKSLPHFGRSDEITDMLVRFIRKS